MDLPLQDPIGNAKIVPIEDPILVSFYEYENPFINHLIKYESWLKGLYYYNDNKQQREWQLEQINTLNSDLHVILDNGGSLSEIDGIGDEYIVLENLIKERKQGFLIGKEVILRHNNGEYFFDINDYTFQLHFNINNEPYYIVNNVHFYADKIIANNKIYKKPEGFNYVKTLCNELYYKDYFPDEFKIGNKIYYKPDLKYSEQLLRTKWNLDMPIIHEWE